MKLNEMTFKDKLRFKVIILSPFFDIFLFTIFLYLKYLFFYETNTIRGALFFTDTGKIYTLASLILIGSLFYFLSSRKRKWTLWGIGAFLSILMFVDALYFRHFRDYTSFSLIHQMNQVGDIKETIIQLFKPADVLYLVDVLIIALLMVVIKPKTQISKNKVKATTFIVFFTIWSIAQFVQLYSAFAYSSFENRNTNSITACQVGAVNFHILDTYDYLVKQLMTKELSKEELTEIKTSFTHQPAGKPLSNWGIFQGKNIIMVQMESMSQYVVNLKIEGKEVTPNLNRLTEQGYFATNFYTQIGDGHTSDAEFIVLNSLFPLSKGSVSVMYGTNEYYSLPEILKEEGYYTFSAHGYREEFWNRINMHKALDFQESYFANQYNMKEIAGIGISDREFFIQTVDKIKTLPTPFFSFLITLQNHEPFDAKDISFELGKLEGTKVGSYIQSSHEADKAIGVLMKELEESGLLENTIIVLYGDHDAEISQEDMRKLYPDVSQIDMYKFRKVPFIIVSPEKELVMTDDQPLGQIDVMPSLLHLLGVEVSPNIMYGENLFLYRMDKTVGTIRGWHIEKDVIFGNEYDSSNKGKAFDLKTEKEREVTEDMIKTSEMYKDQAKNSDLLIRTNGIKDLKEKE
jgi:lipoteichoic acid synthase